MANNVETRNPNKTLDKLVRTSFQKASFTNISMPELTTLVGVGRKMGSISFPYDKIHHTTRKRTKGVIAKTVRQPGGISFFILNKLFLNVRSPTFLWNSKQ